MKLLLFAASAAAALIAVPAMAQTEAGRWSLSLEGGAELPVDGELNGGRNVAIPDLGVVNPALAGESAVLRVNPTDYNDLYGTGWSVGGEVAYGLDDNAEVFGTLRYSAFDEGSTTFGRLTNTTTGETVPLNAQFDERNVWIGDIGYRRYFGDGQWKPYAAARVGAAYTEGISANFNTPGGEVAFNNVTFYDDSWSWTVGGDVGVSYQASDQFALQAEVGLRYISDLSDESGPGLTALGLSELNGDSGSSITMPVMVRGKYTW